jgi:hypothetical protein
LKYNKTKNTIKLIGYKKIKVPEDELVEFEEHYDQNYKAWKDIVNTHYDRKATTLRIYFPVKDGMVKHHNKILEADEVGELGVEEVHGDCSVIGRKQTKDITGVKGNIIKDGVIYLEVPNKPTHRHDNVYVYDFGVKVVHDHSHGGELKTRDGIDIRAVSCINNHGGPNCSDKFNIHKGRCTFKKNACMDFNGWFTNCVNASPSSFTGVRNFPGSDCDYSMGRGHCWNEVM